MTDAGSLPLLLVPAVAHVGTWPDGPRRHARGESQEGIGLSVSLVPDSWIRIAKLGGLPVRWLVRVDGRPGRFADGYAARPAAEAAAEAAGLAHRVPVVRVEFFDDEFEDDLVMTFATDAEAAAEADMRGLDPSAIRPGTELEIDGLDARFAAFGITQRPWRPSLEAELVNRYVAALDPSLDGVWWADDHDPDRLSAPRGLIFPERLDAWRVAPDQAAAARSGRRSSPQADPTGA